LQQRSSVCCKFRLGTESMLILQNEIKYFSYVRLHIYVSYIKFCVRFEAFTAVIMKNGVFWDLTPCGSCKNRLSPILVILMMEAVTSSETSVVTRATQRYIPEVAILHKILSNTEHKSVLLFRRKVNSHFITQICKISGFH
jgi:hypothetical protein